MRARNPLLQFFAGLVTGTSAYAQARRARQEYERAQKEREEEREWLKEQRELARGQVQRTANQQLGQILAREALNRQDPGRVLKAATPLLRGEDAPQTPGWQYQPAGGGPVPPTIGGFPTSLPGEPEYVAALRNNPDLSQVAQEQRRTSEQEAAAAKQRAAEDLERLRHAGRQQLAQLKILAQQGSADAKRELDWAELYFMSGGDPARLDDFLTKNRRGHGLAAPALDTRPVEEQLGRVGGGGLLGPAAVPPKAAAPQAGAPTPSASEFFPHGTRAQATIRQGEERVSIAQQNADTARYRAEGYVQAVRDRNDLAARWQDIQRSLGEARLGVQRESNRLREKGLDLNRLTAQERLDFQRGQDAWRRDLANANLALKTAADAEPSTAIRDQYRSLLSRGETLEKQANAALQKGDLATYERLRAGSDSFFRQAQELMATYTPPPPPKATPRPAAKTGASRSTPRARGAADPASDPLRPRRLYWISEFKKRHGRAPTPKEVNDITDALKAGTLR